MDPSRPKTRDPDEWVELCPEFSRPMVEELRGWFARWEPDLTEAIKWNNLCFSARKLVCGISGCKRHVGLFFFQGNGLRDVSHILCGGETAEGGTVRITSLEQLDREALRRVLWEAVELDAEPIPRPRQAKREPWPVPDFFAAELAKKKHARAAERFSKLSPSCQREWLVWLSTAKRPETRAARLAQALHALAHGRKWIDRKMA